MMQPSTLGNLCLNLSFALYLILYLPQIHHNKKSKHLMQLSTSLHLILFTSFILDLIYSVLKPLPWQYQTVSIVASGLLAIQHIQLMQLAYQQRSGTLRLLTHALFFFLMLLGSFFYFKPQITSPKLILTLGYISRIGFLTYTLPQIIQNYRIQSTQALSTLFLKLSLLLSTLDLISAWCLDWGWPNKLGTPITLLLTLTLLWQRNRYRPLPPGLK